MVDLNVIRKWKTAKPLILGKWDKLKEKELEQTQAKFDEVVKLVQKYYDLPRENIESELHNLVEQIKTP